MAEGFLFGSGAIRIRLVENENGMVLQIKATTLAGSAGDLIWILIFCTEGNG
ncbi:MAG: hypothetical protein Q8O94_03325 [bacterium]|nr:hypothetical protein [bacterium]